MRSEIGNLRSSFRSALECSFRKDVRIKRAEYLWTVWSLSFPSSSFFLSPNVPLLRHKFDLSPGWQNVSGDTLCRSRPRVVDRVFKSNYWLTFFFFSSSSSFSNFFFPLFCFPFSCFRHFFPPFFSPLQSFFLTHFLLSYFIIFLGFFRYFSFSYSLPLQPWYNP